MGHSNPWLGALAAVLALGVSAVVAPAAGQPTGSAEPLMSGFPQLRDQLVSVDFAQREAGQKQLDALGPAQLEDLRRLAKGEKDAEVKARLEGRVAAIEVYILTHPKPLTLDVRDAPLTTAAAELNRQLGGDFVAVTGNPGRYTLLATDEPFWKIILDLQRQNPFAIAASTMTSVAGIQSRIRLTQGTVQRFQLLDTFLARAEVIGQPATGTWSVRVAMMSDPRVRVVGFGPLRLERISDQDGRSLMPLLLPGGGASGTVLRPTAAWNIAATLEPAPAVTRIRELRAGMPIKVLEKEGSMTLDLTDEALALPAPPGRFSAVKVGETIQLRVEAPEGAARPAASLTMRVFDKDGRAIQFITTTLTQGTMSLSRTNVPPAKVEITWTESWREVVLPVEFRDLPMPLVAPVPPDVQPARPVPLLDLR